MWNQRFSRLSKTPPRILVLLIGGSQLLLGAGCKREEIHAYRVPRETESTFAPSQQTNQMNQSSPSQQTSREVGWVVPESWQEVETTSSMRIATFRPSNGLEVAVTSFPGDVGGLLANVNRWRGQVGVESTDEQGLGDVIEQLDGVDIVVVDIAGADKRLVGTIINVGDGKTWFVKAIGPADAVEEVKADLVAFSASFHLHQHTNESNAQPAGVQSTPPPSTAPPASGPAQWTPPAEWKKDEKASPMLMSAFFADTGARITLTSLVGEGGGALANINRWRGQLGLDQLSTLSDQALKDLGNGAISIDLISQDKQRRMVAGIVPVGGQTLYFKLTGSVPQVETELVRFNAFVNAVGQGRVGEP